MFGSRTAKFVHVLALTLVIVVLFAGMALADNLQSDLNTTTGGLQKTVGRGTLSPSTAYTQNVFLYVDEQPSDTNTPTYPFDVTLGSGSFGATFSGVTITGPGTANGQSGIVGWTTPAAQATSKTYDLVVTFNASTAINENPASITITFTIAAGSSDTTPPDTSILTHPNTTTNSTSASFTYSSTEAGTFQCSLDAAVFTTCPNVGISYSSLSEGSHTFDVRAKDAANNIDASPASFSWTIDLTAPDTTISDGPPSLTNSQSATFVYSSEPGATFECRLDAASFGACPSGTPMYSGLAEGSHTFYVRATDAVGNTDATPASYGWTIDLTPPALSAPDLVAASDSGTSATDNVTNDNTPTLEGTADPGSSFELFQDDVSVYTTTIGAGGTWSFTSAALLDGSYTFVAKATDAAGNTATSSGLTVMIDTTAPVITYVDRTLANTYGWNNGDVTLNWSCTDDRSGVVDATVSQTVSTEGTNQSSTGTCHDKAGNSASDIQSGINIDKTAPVITFSSRLPAANGFGWNNTDVTVTWSCTDDRSGVVDATVSQTVSTEGTNQSSTGTCQDKAENSASDTQTGISIDKVSPDHIVWNGGPADLGAYDVGAVPAAPTCSASDSLSGFDSCIVTGWSDAMGSHTMTATAYDKAGNTAMATRTYTVHWTIYGFYQPVDMGGVWNTVKNGSTVPLKWEMFAGTTEITDPSTVTMSAKLVECASGTEDAVEALSSTGGTTSPRYDTTAGQFIYNWQTPKKPGTCYAVTMSAGFTQITAKFKLK